MYGSTRSQQINKLIPTQIGRADSINGNKKVAVETKSKIKINTPAPKTHPIINFSPINGSIQLPEFFAHALPVGQARPIW